MSITHYLMTGAAITTGGIVATIVLVAIRRHLEKLPYSDLRLYHRFVLGILITVSMMLVICGLVVLNLPSMFSSLMVALICSSVLYIALRIRRADRIAFYRSLEMAIDNGVPVDHVADVFAISRSDILSERAARFSSRMRSGQKPLEAANNAGLRLPLQTQTRLLLQKPTPELDCFEEDESIVARRATMLIPYISTVILITCAVTAYFSARTLPMVRDMLLDFGLDVPPVYDMIYLYPLVSLITGCLLSIVLIGWLLLHLGYAQPLEHCLPIIGPYYAKMRRADLLSALAVMLSAGKSTHEAFAGLSEDIRDTESIGRFKKVMTLLQSGTLWPDALSRAGIVDARSAVWLTAAESTNQVAPALDSVAESIRRRARYRRAAALSIAAPILIVIVAIPIMLASFGLMSALSTLTEALG